LPPDRATPDSEHQLNRFLQGVETRALVIAELATRNREEALDLVQESMMAFAGSYRKQPESEWPPLFHRVLQNRIRDWHRRSKVRNRLFGWLGFGSTERGEDPVQTAADPHSHGPEEQIDFQHAGNAAILALEQLPERQRQAFLLRHWEGLDVRETARAMGCSQGSVKTHLSRALANLRARLEEHAP